MKHDHGQRGGSDPKVVKIQGLTLYRKQYAAMWEPARVSCIESTTKAGKAQPLDSTVWTRAGAVPFGSLKVGDEVATPNGYATVDAIYPQGVRQCYRVTLNDGSTCEADAEHLWEVHEFGARGKTHVRLFTTAEIAEWPEMRRRKAWVPEHAAVEFRRTPVALDPYLIGLLIGDGGLTRGTAILSSEDAEVLDSAERMIPAGYRLKHVAGCDYAITAGAKAARTRADGGHLMGRLRRLGLCCYSYQKGIPEIYKVNTIATRVAVLQGILDTDGSVNAHGQPTLEQTSERLARDVAWLVRSLGGSVLTQCKLRSGYKDKAGVFVQCRPVWRQVIKLPAWVAPFRLTRKAVLYRVQAKTGHRFFRTVEPSRMAECQCIQVSDPRALYLTDDFIPTHNTRGCLQWQFTQVVEGRPHADHWWVAPSYSQAGMAFRLAWRLYGLPLAPLGATQNKSDLTITMPNQARWVFKTAEKPDLLYGEKVWSLVIDEASRCRDEAIHACWSTMTVTRGPIRMIGNVRGRHNLHYQWSRKGEAGEPGFAYHRITADDAIAAGVFRQEDVDQARAALPPAVFRQLYYCEPSDDGANPFGIDAIARALARQGGKLAPGPARVFGVDVARARDWTVIVGLNSDRNVCAFERFHGGSWDAIAERIGAVCNGTPGKVDATGAGDAVFEQVQKRWPQARPFIFSNPSKQGLVERLSVGLQSGRLGIVDGVLKSELEAFEYSSSHSGGRHVVRYEAPPGAHDDAVCALALAWECAEEYGISPSNGGAARAIVVPVPGGGLRTSGRSSGRW